MLKDNRGEKDGVGETERDRKIEIERDRERKIERKEIEREMRMYQDIGEATGRRF